VFVGGRSQRGHGIGSFFSGFGRMILPWLKTGGKALLREGVGTGLQVAQDALGGRNVGESFREHAKQAGQRLLHGAADHLNQSGRGMRKRRLPAPPGSPARKRIKRQTPTRSVHTKPNKTRAQFSDIFA
jgi:hypothetical protein